MKILGRIRFYLQYFCVGFSACLVFMILLILFSSSNAAAISTHSLSLSTNTPTLESTINNTADEEVNIQKHELTINTDNPNGAKVLISSKDNKTTPSYVTGSGPSTGSGSTGTSTIAESTGTISAPTKLSPNSFGFALDKNSSAIASSFNSSTTYESTDNTDKLTAKFTKLTPSTTPTEIYNKSGNHNNTKLSVYYGTNLNSLMREGKYELDILYTIVSNTPTTDIPEDNNDTIETSPKLLPVRENQTFYKDNTITIKTNIKANKPINSTDITIKINNKPCTDITISQNFEQNISKTLELTCKASQNTATRAGNKYDLNFTINKYKINTTKKNAINYIIPTPMQTFQYSQCTSMNEHEEKFMIDTRDNELYTMAKLKDGKCWMTQNLRYQLSTTRALTPQDSDVQQNWTPSRSTELALTGSWSQDPEGHKTVHSYYNAYKPGYGVYYTHTAATAGTTANMNNNGDEATGSICPKGWRLPKTTTQSDSINNDFYQMARHYKGSASWNHNNGWGYWNGSHGMTEFPQNFVRSGYRNDYSAGTISVDYGGYWWSSTVESNFSAYHIYLLSNRVHPRLGGVRYRGFSVRCLAREPQTVGEIQHMQDFTSAMCTNMTEHQTATLKDKRDNNTYAIAKLKDGKCWMTQNLRLKLDTSTPLKPTDSDVTQNWTPPRSTDTASCQSGTRWYQDSEGSKTVRSCYQSESTYNTNGVYYTHTAATAGTTANMDNNGDEATGSICPKGWRLPKTGTIAKSTNNEFYNMAQHYIGSMSWYDSSSDYGYWKNGTHNMLSSPPNFIYSGLRWYDARGVALVGSAGCWWSSTVNSSNHAHNLDVSSSYVNPGDNPNRDDGFPVRCIAR